MSNPLEQIHMPKEAAGATAALDIAKACWSAPLSCFNKAMFGFGDEKGGGGSGSPEIEKMLNGFMLSALNTDKT